MDYMRYASLTAGFTSSRYGISSFQRENLMQVLSDLKPPKGRHGDCTGGDEEFHLMCRSLDIPLAIHPPVHDRWRAFCKPGLLDEVMEPKPYLPRDRDIVIGSGVLIACPRSEEEPSSLRGLGTWITVTYARKANIGIIILYPSGRMEVDGTPVAR